MTGERRRRRHPHSSAMATTTTGTTKDIPGSILIAGLVMILVLQLAVGLWFAFYYESHEKLHNLRPHLSMSSSSSSSSSSASLKDHHQEQQPPHPRRRQQQQQQQKSSSTTMHTIRHLMEEHAISAGMKVMSGVKAIADVPWVSRMSIILGTNDDTMATTTMTNSTRMNGTGIRVVSNRTESHPWMVSQPVPQTATTKTIANFTRKGNHHPNNNDLNSNDNNHGSIPSSFSLCRPLGPYPFPEHGCTVSGYSLRPHCQFQPFRMDQSLITGQARGGEPLDMVRGQSEAMEWLHYTRGAFQINQTFVSPWPSSNSGSTAPSFLHYVQSVLQATIEVGEMMNDPKSCDVIWNGTTLMITRYEYANLYHTMTEWWNAFFSVPTTTTSTGSSSNNNNNNNNISMKEITQRDFPVNVVFLDAHPKGIFDSVWKDLFRGRVQHARHLPNVTCFEKVRLVPAGYTCPLHPNNTPKMKPSCPHERWQTAEPFLQHLLNTWSITSSAGSKTDYITGRVVVIDRVPFVAHARSEMQQTDRMLSNLQALAMALPQQLPVTVDVVTLVNDSLPEQIQMIRRAHVLIGNHGAGLTHALFLMNGAHVIELSCRSDPDHANGFFGTISTVWKPNITHHCAPSIHSEQQEPPLLPQPNVISKEYWYEHVISTLQSVLGVDEPKGKKSIER